MGRLSGLIDDLGIQRGVTLDVIEAHILTPEQAAGLRIEPEVLRSTLRAEDIKAFRPLPTMRIIYTTKHTKPRQVPNAIEHLQQFRTQIICKEVKNHRHPWWRLHRPRAFEIFARPKFIGLTTTRNVELVWDADDQLVVTDAMYVFEPREGVPFECLMANAFLFIC